MIKKKKSNIDLTEEDNEDYEDDDNNTDCYKTLTYFDHNNVHFKTFNFLAKISKNVYNNSIYCIQIFNKFKYDIFKKLYFQLKNNSNIDTSNFIKNELLYYYQIYSNIKQNIQSNNNYIYKMGCEASR